jgi:RimJ/RimL family protein N-acetyltransferase
MSVSFESPRLRVQPICQADFGSIHELLSIPETDRYNALGIPEEYSQTERLASEWVALMATQPVFSYTLTIERLSDQSFVGMYGLKLSAAKYRAGELWYKLHKDHWGQGYATEITKSALRYCFEELNLHRVEAGVAVENIASIRVLEKAGMTREGMKRKNLPLSTGFSDSFVYAMLREDL